jgi:hypothetical protein
VDHIEAEDHGDVQARLEGGLLDLVDVVHAHQVEHRADLAAADLIKQGLARRALRAGGPDISSWPIFSARVILPISESTWLGMAAGLTLAAGSMSSAAAVASAVNPVENLYGAYPTGDHASLPSSLVQGDSRPCLVDSRRDLAC